MLQIDVLTIFPELFGPFVETAFVGHARRENIVSVTAHDLRNWTTDRHRSVDDSPFGGGAGMVLLPEPVFRTVESVDPPRPIYYLGPAGKRFDQAGAHVDASQRPHDVALCLRRRGSSYPALHRACAIPGASRAGCGGPRPRAWKVLLPRVAGSLSR